MFTPRRIIPVIVVSQFAGTSLWFAGNAILPDLQRRWNLDPDALASLTSAVQLGFILGTLFFALFAIADRFSARYLFLISSLSGALINACTLFAESFTVFLALRFLTGICLAGIYPIGMRIAAGWYREGLGHAIGFLVGALVVGTAFPHLVKGLRQTLEWQAVTIVVSILAASGGFLMVLALKEGPHLSSNNVFTLRAIPAVFSESKFRSAAFAYFGHMWELYTFWAFVPFLLSFYQTLHPTLQLNIPLWSFLIIGAGAVGCVGGGLLSRRIGSARVAFVQLFVSGFSCLISPFMLHTSPEIWLSFLIVWGITVVGDSPQFSSLAATVAPRQFVGTALTVMNGIGFLITVVSIAVVGWLTQVVAFEYIFLFLTLGPALGLRALYPLVTKGS
ncbi:MAG TPA: MFS transporter [Bacteroidota bacterium]|nr:MFS transporter [Bacteroidota bacterium]